MEAHGDLTFADGQSAIDFQDMMWGLEEQDLANTLFGLRRDDSDGTLVEEFRHAYTSNRPLPELDDALLKQLQIARRLQRVNLALTIRRPGIANFLNGHAAELRKEMTYPSN
jgi:Ser/Thr protein kinase RdoA (MazF antagonist)